MSVLDVVPWMGGVGFVTTAGQTPLGASGDLVYRSEAAKDLPLWGV